MGESRVELLAWINALLQLNYTKIEQLGTGAAYAEVFDSIWGGLQMSKVKFDARLEYEYIANYKVLQIAFEQHRVDKVIPVEKLIKCKFQENLEFLQWSKRFHDMYFPGGYYDAPARRTKSGGAGSAHGSTTKLARAGASSSVHSSRTSLAGGGTTTRPAAQKRTGLSPRPGSASGPVGANAAALAALQQQVEEMSHVNEEQGAAITTLEKERDFYYGKLRDIEILVQQEAARGVTSDLMALIQQILYATDDGFEVPDEAAGDDMGSDVYYGDQHDQEVDDYDMETF
ncbi:calponin homology domain-containing protein [Blastocladiella britannica]|nr:calponin homology domain-containing protein [Blastocladiella britannica]